MRIDLISFTECGAKLGYELMRALKGQGHEIQGFTMEKYALSSGLLPLKEPLKAWTKRAFYRKDALIFIGATGICIRSIAPFIEDKRKDPAVIVLDEKGKFVIPILSGHLGGANALANMIADELNAQPVMTTATDINDKFAVDLFAKKHQLTIMDMTIAKEISAAALRDETIGFVSELPYEGCLPDGVKALEASKTSHYGIHVAIRQSHHPFERTLHLIPRIVTLGIGCRKNTEEATISQLVDEVLENHDIARVAIEQVVSVDLKKNEAGLVSYCKKQGWPFKTYSVEVLSRVTGEFTDSEYVKSVMGVGNICERAAVLGSDGGNIIQRKYAKDGVTVSVAVKDWKLRL